MIIQVAELYGYTLPLQSPLLMRGHSLTHRKGILLKLVLDGAVGYGDIAPFPNLHRETFEEALLQSKRAVSLLLSKEITENVHGLELCSSLFEEFSWFPSVRFGFETALLQLKASLEQKTVASYLNPNAHLSIPVNGLLSGSLEKILFHANRLKEEGYQAVKLKVGNASYQEDIEKVYRVREVLGLEIALRLDANRRWSLKEAISFGREVRSASIEYIEEPLQNAQELEFFFQETGIFLALDETLSEEKNLKKFLQKNSGIKAFVLKPNLFPSLSSVQTLIQFAEQHHIWPVMSDVFLSGVGLSAEINLAASLIQSCIPAGFDTYQYLEEDILRQRLPFHRGCFSLAEVNDFCMAINL